MHSPYVLLDSAFAVVRLAARLARCLLGSWNHHLLLNSCPWPNTPKTHSCSPKWLHAHTCTYKHMQHTTHSCWPQLGPILWTGKCTHWMQMLATRLLHPRGQGEYTQRDKRTKTDEPTETKRRSRVYRHTGWAVSTSSNPVYPLLTGTHISLTLGY